MGLRELELLHRDRCGRASDRAEAAPDALRFVIEERSQRAFAGHHFAEPRRVVQALGRDEAQAVLGTDIDASVAEHAFGSVVDRMDMAVQASLGLLAGLDAGIAGLDFGDAAAALDG